ncbi:Oidioi.mRNA.OKI2018_I69.chr1.g2783.t1.cds [Oikopleura dioica]|uniref:5'-nucleotidase n=1 Tax=Oikopleura dioica TaxID=34765 RepID=A0ABN7SZ13_OIKDI|nr:Oidioi.mRNA.OKI2018_I69.chr1.g2783.t1.cds [Oikopleura dioica]
MKLKIKGVLFRFSYRIFSNSDSYNYLLERFSCQRIGRYQLIGKRSMSTFAAQIAVEDKVLVGDAVKVNAKVAEINKAGAKEIQCVFDFDATISKHKHNGEHAASCHTALEKTLGEEKYSEMVELRNKFIKIEFDPALTPEEKSPHMTEWWSTAHKKIVEHHVQKQKIQESVRKSAIHIRERNDEFFKLLEKTPVLLFSAGIKQIVEYAMEYKAAAGLTSNMDVVSNEMIFDENENVVDFSEPLIHTFTKNTQSIGETWRRKLRERKNVLLMGDSEGDPDMVRDDDLAEGGTCLRVGFLNRDSPEAREKYQKLYDIVIVDDESLSVPIKIVQAILSVDSE